jgi:hypothetical protein
MVGLGDVSRAIVGASKKLIHITKISVGTSTTLAMLLMMPLSHASLTLLTPSGGAESAGR